MAHRIVVLWRGVLVQSAPEDVVRPHAARMPLARARLNRRPYTAISKGRYSAGEARGDHSSLGTGDQSGGEVHAISVQMVRAGNRCPLMR